ncbi:EamA family transporter RarD [Thalassorhabdus alkalitolerans]|uniref:EamA family transporter RarD n=1 Tax=Thalassorhabdus alkalitolerans TaxID=2282697 RepID=A0ABW0YMT0_9BACI
MREQQTAGVIAAISAYLLWGFLPLYWKFLSEVPSSEVLAQRIIWSLLFMMAALFLMGRLKDVLQEVKGVFASKQKTWAVILASLFISTNWFIFIFAVNSDRVIEASLGYYINPLINVLLAAVFLKERLTMGEKSAFILAAAGVFLLTTQYEGFPWAALALALSFGCYGLIKKVVNLGAWAGLTIETLMVTPFALLFIFFFVDGEGFIRHYGIEQSLLLIGAGAVTAIPLLLFAAGARRISFSLVGFLQYLAPTIMLGLGVFLFHEPFSGLQLTSFIIIWTGLFIFTISRSAVFRKEKRKKRDIQRETKMSG